MREPLTLFFSFLIGVVVGGPFFGGLWWTVRKGLMSSRPEFWFLGSFVLRTAIALAGFYTVLPGGINAVFACLVGFVLAKIAVGRLMVPSGSSGEAIGAN